jgi:hypothetical protein
MLGLYMEASMAVATVSRLDRAAIVAGFAIGVIGKVAVPALLSWRFATWSATAKVVASHHRISSQND